MMLDLGGRYPVFPSQVKLLTSQYGVKVKLQIFDYVKCSVKAANVWLKSKSSPHHWPYSIFWTFYYYFDNVLQNKERTVVITQYEHVLPQYHH